MPAGAAASNSSLVYTPDVPIVHLTLIIHHVPHDMLRLNSTIRVRLTIAVKFN